MAGKKKIIRRLNKALIKLITTEVRDSFTDEELKKFKDFEEFYDWVDVQNAFEEEWRPKFYKPYYKEVYNNFMEQLS